MTPAEKLKQTILNITKTADVTLDGEVTEVDMQEYTCTVKLANDLELFDVQLKALKGKSPCAVLIPKIGSHVQMINVGNPDWMILSCGEVDSYIIDASVTVEIKSPKVTIGATDTIEIDCTKVVLNGGEKGGLVIVADLVSRLNKIEAGVNDFISQFNSHTHPYSDNGTPVTTSPILPANAFTGTLSQTKRSDMENEEIKH